jgi:peptide/nickel transport system permease protein
VLQSFANFGIGTLVAAQINDGGIDHPIGLRNRAVGAYLIRRLLLMILTLFGISVIIFVMLRVVPGNIADILFDAAGMVSQAEKQKLEAELGLDKPIVIQYVNWIGGLARGDFGYTYVSEQPALDEILPRIPVTAKLAGLALMFSILFGVPLGVVSAVRQNTLLDYVLRVISLSGLSLPSFWLGLLILMVFVRYLGWIPIYTNQPASLWDELLLLSIPAAAVGFRASALLMRLTRSSMLEVLRQDYIRTARAKGASPAAINYNHALRNAVLPIITIIGIEAAFLIGGLIVTETVFNIPGVARFLVEAIRWRDYPVVQNLVMFIAVVVVTVNFLVDMAYAVLDPRIKYED